LVSEVKYFFTFPEIFQFEQFPTGRTS